MSHPLEAVVAKMSRRIVGTFLLVVTLVATAEQLTNRFLLGMSARELAQQSLAWAIFGSVFALSCGGIALWLLRPLRAMLRLSEQESVNSLAIREKARASALRFPLSIILSGLALAAVLTVAKTVLDYTVFGLPLAATAAMACRVASIALGLGVFLYAIIRGWMLPIIAHFRQEDVPPGSRISLRGRVAFAVVAVALAVSIPMAVVSRGRTKSMAAESSTRYQLALAEALARMATVVGADEMREIAAALHHQRIRVHFENHPGRTGAALPKGQRAAFVHVHSNKKDEKAPDLTVLVVLGALILGFALFIGGDQGLNLSRDVHRISGRIRALTAEQRGGDATLAPVVADAPQTRELRDLADAINALMARMAQMHVTHFVAMEKTIEADRVRTQFLANMSHDLRSPLNAILGFAELLWRGMEGELTEEQLSSVHVIHDNGTHLLRMINEVLDSAKVEAGRLEMHKEDAPAAEVLSAALKEVGYRDLPEGVSVETSLVAGLPVVSVDTPRIAEALCYLICFCAEATESGVTIAISTKAGDGAGKPRRLLFEIGDESPGVSADERELLFTRFSRRAGQDALGLELPLARTFFELHDGALDLVSEPGEGNRFIGEIPVQQRRALGRLRNVRV